MWRARRELQTPRRTFDRLLLSEGIYPHAKKSIDADRDSTFSLTGVFHGTHKICRNCVNGVGKCDEESPAASARARKLNQSTLTWSDGAASRLGENTRFKSTRLPAGTGKEEEEIPTDPRCINRGDPMLLSRRHRSSRRFASIIPRFG